MKFLIYGAGALGQALGGMLAAGGHEVDMLLRERFYAAIKAEGIRVTGIYGEFLAPAEALGLFTSIDEAQGAHYDYILLTTKAYDTAKAVTDITRLGENCSVVSMQNGCGNIEQLQEAFGATRSLGGRVITGFEIERPGSVKITVSADAVHVGDSRSGSISQKALELAKGIDQAGLPCIGVENIHSSLYAKLLYNCALNPLGALLGVHYGLLSESSETRGVMNQVIEETFQVICGLGGRTPWPDASAYQDFFYSKLLPMTYDHRPSMLQDLDNKKPTEVDALVGYVSLQGKKLGLSTPTCDVLTSLVRFKEQQNLL